jgi:hypothetical protein
MDESHNIGDEDTCIHCKKKIVAVEIYTDITDDVERHYLGWIHVDSGEDPCEDGKHLAEHTAEMFS